MSQQRMRGRPKTNPHYFTWEMSRNVGLAYSITGFLTLVGELITNALGAFAVIFLPFADGQPNQFLYIAWPISILMGIIISLLPWRAFFRSGSHYDQRHQLETDERMHQALATPGAQGALNIVLAYYGDILSLLALIVSIAADEAAYYVLFHRPAFGTMKFWYFIVVVFIISLLLNSYSVIGLIQGSHFLKEAVFEREREDHLGITPRQQAPRQQVNRTPLPKPGQGGNTQQQSALPPGSQQNHPQMLPTGRSTSGH